MPSLRHQTFLLLLWLLAQLNPLEALAAPSDSSPAGSYVAADPAQVHSTPARKFYSHSSRVIFLNGCHDGGCALSPGAEDSRFNRSSILSETALIPPFSGGAMEWDAIVRCVQETYEPFNIEITEVDPGDAPHFEAIVAGGPSAINLPTGIAGVAPFSCGAIINNAITFTFPEAFNNQVEETCWTVAQESAHAFGLDHEFLCSDPMTYLQSCSPRKYFQNQDAPCGEYDERPCQCNGNTQNSYAYLLEHFGKGQATPPEVRILSPTHGDEVAAQFVVQVSAEDDIAVERVELFANGVLLGDSTLAPHFFTAPLDLQQGRLRLQAFAYDSYGNRGSDEATVRFGALCRREADCLSPSVCVQGGCVPGPDTAAGLGTTCQSDQACASQRCGHGIELSLCTEACAQDSHCPEGFACLPTAEESVCWPQTDGGCAVTHQGPWPWLLLVVILYVPLRRRRQY